MEILVQFLFYHIEMPVKREFFSNKEKQNNISASLQMGGTLASLLTIKTANKESSFEPPAD